MIVITWVNLNAINALYCLTVFTFGSSEKKTGGDCWLISNLAIMLWIILLGKLFAADWENRKRMRKASVKGSKAQLIEGAGLRKHLPVRSTEHLSDPAHIRWFPCLRYLPVAPCGPAPIACPGPLLFPAHSLILRGLVTSQLLLSHQNHCTEEKLALNQPGTHWQTEELL